MIPVMNGHNTPQPSPPLPLPEPLRQRPALSLLLSALLGAMGARCSPEVVRPLQQIVDRLEHCPEPPRVVEAKRCDPPCKTNEVCSNGTCVNVASERNMTFASEYDPLPRVILEIRTR